MHRRIAFILYLQIEKKSSCLSEILGDVPGPTESLPLQTY